jgi:hypothetical protein
MISGENPNIPSRWIRYRPDALIRLDFFFKKAKKRLTKGFAFGILCKLARKQTLEGRAGEP